MSESLTSGSVGGAGWVTTGSTRKPTPYSVRSFLAPASGRGSPLAFGFQMQKGYENSLFHHASRSGH